MPTQTLERYQKNKTASKLVSWRFNQKSRTVPEGKNLRIEVLAPAMVHWTPDDWQTTNDSKTIDTGLGVHYVDLPTNRLSPDSKMVFKIGRASCRERVWITDVNDLG